MHETHYYKRKYESFSKDSNTAKYDLLIIAVVFLLMSLFCPLLAFRSNSIDFKLAIILSTILFQLAVTLRFKRLYTFKEIYLYFIHPAFYINFAVVAYFFIPLIFYLFYADIFYTWVDIEEISIPLIFFCASIFILNILFLICDKGTKNFSGETEGFYQIINVLRRGMPILIVFYALAWVTRILMILVGAYSRIYMDAETSRHVQTQYPLLYPSFMFFNAEIYFPVMFVFWILYNSAFKSNKYYRWIMIIFLVADVVFFLPTGGKQGVLTPVLAAGLAGVMLKQKIPKKAIVFVLLFLLALPIHNSFRTLRGSREAKDLLEHATATGATKYGETKAFLFMSTEAVFRRAEAFSSYFYFTQRVQNDFFGGTTYKSIVTKLIPGFLWTWPAYLQDKSLRERFRDYGILGTNERMLGGAPAIWGEFYLNFGYTGLIIGVPLVGMACLFMFSYVLRCWKLRNVLAYFWIPFVFLLLAHGQIALLVVPVIKIAIVLFVIDIFLAIIRVRKY